jgi:IS4 transposase
MPERAKRSGFTETTRVIEGKADRGFFGYDLFTQAAATKADLLFRVRANQQLDPHRLLADGSSLCRIYAHPNERRKGEGGVEVRAIEYTIEGQDETYRLVTTILDPDQAPADELARLYHERWEIEGAFEEIRTHLKGSHLPLRSKTPDLVIQEFWGLMLCHWAIRELMHQAAKHRTRDPDEISFVAALRLVRRTLPSRAALSPSAPQNLETPTPRRTVPNKDLEQPG